MIINFSGNSITETTSFTLGSGQLPRVCLSLFEGWASLKLKVVNAAGETAFQTIGDKEYWIGKCVAGDRVSLVYDGRGCASARVSGFFDLVSDEIVSRDPSLPQIVISNTLARQANTTAYSAGQLIGGAAATGFASNGFTFSNFARGAGGRVRLDRARLYKSQANLLGSFELRVFRAQPTITIGDTGSFSAGVPIGAGGANARLVARFAFDFTTAVQGSDGSELAATTLSGFPAFVGLPNAGTDLFGLLVATGGYTPLSGETFSAVLEGLAF